MHNSILNEPFLEGDNDQAEANEKEGVTSDLKIGDEDEGLEYQRIVEEELQHWENTEKVAHAEALANIASGGTQEDIIQDEEDPDNPVDDYIIHVKDMKLSVDFMMMLKDATIENDLIEDDMKHQLCNPPTELLDLSNNLDLLLAIEIFMAVPTRDSYESIRAAFMKRNLENKLLSHEEVKKSIRQLTGMVFVFDSNLILKILKYLSYRSDQYNLTYVCQLMHCLYWSSMKPERVFPLPWASLRPYQTPEKWRQDLIFMVGVSHYVNRSHYPSNVEIPRSCPSFWLSP